MICFNLVNTLCVWGTGPTSFVRADGRARLRMAEEIGCFEKCRKSLFELIFTEE